MAVSHTRVCIPNLTLCHIFESVNFDIYPRWLISIKINQLDPNVCRESLVKLNQTTMFECHDCFGKVVQRDSHIDFLFLNQPNLAGLGTTGFDSGAFLHTNESWYIAFYVRCNKAASVSGIASFCLPVCENSFNLALSSLLVLLVLSYIITTNLSNI